MRRVTGALAGLCVLAGAGVAQASNGLESPEGGVQQVSRGGAWVARADNPLATYYNPAGLAWQPGGAHLGAQLMIRSHCFERRGPDGQPVSPDGFSPAPPGEVCADTPPFPNPHLGVTIRPHKQWAIGIAAVGPHTHGSTEWPTTIRYANNFGIEADFPSPQRYMLLKNDAILLLPTASVAFSPIKSLSIGAGFVWGVASVEFSAMTEAVSPQRMNPDDFSNDVKATLSSTDGFIPGFVVGVLWEPIRRLSIGGWYRFSDKISSSTDLRAEADFFQASGAVNPAPVVTEIEDAGRLELQIPMEARIGFRYRHPRSGNPRCQDFVEKHRGYVRDAYSQDLFDLELDLTWAHNSAVDQLTLTFNDRHQINGTPGTVPLDGSIIHNWKDVLGVRLGGEVIPVPDLLALRLGGFFESKGVDDEFLNIDFHVSERVGISGGGGLRFGPVDIDVAYQHTFFFDLDNGGNGQVRGLSGDATTGDFRTRQAINGGNANSSLDEVGLAVSYHF